MTRFPFLKQIEAAWTDSIQNDYDKHKVLSERTLQASLWSNLKDRANDQFIFIEPRIRLPAASGKKPRYVVPDIVVCRAESIIAIIELKFAPRANPDLRQDVEKLLHLYEGREEIELSLRRYMGVEAKKHTYKIEAKTQFVLGCVSNRLPRGLASFLENVQDTALKGRCAVLLAETIENHSCAIKSKRF